MNWRKVILFVVLADFVALTVWAVMTQDVIAYIASLTSSPWGLQIALDLCIAVFVALTWMVKDARKLGIRVAPFVVLSVFAGSIGLLSYMLRREFASDKRAVGSDNALTRPAAA